MFIYLFISSANGDLIFQERSRLTLLLKNWLDEAAINFGVANIHQLSLPIMVGLPLRTLYLPRV
jgi:hypothetical protein